MNVEAKRLLNKTQIKNIKELSSFSPPLVECLQRLKTGGRELIKIPYNGSTLPVSIYVIELAMQNEHFKLVSLQNIQSELEEKEMEAWQNMIRILTHEIMNSVTPISSLASTVNDDILRYIQNEEESVYPAKEDLEDIQLAIRTIQRRSEGLIRFVSDFRNLTRIPNPRIKEVKASELISEVVLLLKKDFDENQITIQVNIIPEDLVISLDKELIGQVLINLLQNATHALSDTEDRDREIEITALIGSQASPDIIIRDNGTGIDEEALGRIFIPFFTTKKQGSGIGLSLSKQIMRKHNGGISVKSEIDKGTEFTLRF
jgi:signal transduction histidine kinase